MAGSDVDLDYVGIGLPPPFDFQLAVLHAARTEDHAQRDAHQVGVVELHAGPLVAVVEEHVHAGRGKIVVESLGRGERLAPGHVERHHEHLVRREGDGPDDAPGVVTGLGHGRHQPVDA